MKHISILIPRGDYSVVNIMGGVDNYWLQPATGTKCKAVRIYFALIWLDFLRLTGGSEGSGKKIRELR
ncbi:hypothetical protein [Thermophagus xiamenensis]|jgi:hypothetical protein|uniref:Uncharacterized protein n=1 Tax=Thermophagus xiamenensis TaxID=385682 RepID=A0A1I2EFX3_9BACT|nr:hypothetical protein [Thermophagus xiamenensis]SFE91547.1 hypothetical protein SAMN05444380_12260 [Thermophagus xiamenensis]